MKTKTFKLGLRYGTWDELDAERYGVCAGTFGDLIDIPAEATTIWITLSKRKPGPNALRISPWGTEVYSHLCVDQWKGYVYEWAWKRLQAFGLPCWATVEWGTE